MPVLQQNPGWADALGLALAGFGVQQGMKRRKQQDERQKQIDAQQAASAQANIDYEKANAQHMQADIGLRKQDLDLRRQMEQDRHNQQIQEQIRKNKEESLKFQEFLEKQLQDKATRSHLQNMDQAQMARISVEIGRLQNEIRKGNISAEQAQERIGIEAGNLGLRQTEEGMREKEFGLQQKKFALEERKEKFQEGQAKGKAAKTNPDRGLEKLPGAVQQTVIKMRKEGVSDQGIIEAVKSSQMPDDIKALTIKALGGSP